MRDVGNLLGVLHLGLEGGYKRRIIRGGLLEGDHKNGGYKREGLGNGGQAHLCP